MNLNASAISEKLKAVLDYGTADIKTELPLSEVSSFKIGGNALLAVFPKSRDAMRKTVKFCKDNSIYHTVIGKGSNVLFSDKGFNGIVIFTQSMFGYTVSDGILTAECGVSITHLSSVACKHSLGGLEFAYGIPGSLGGAVFMNAGAYGGEMKDVVKTVNWYDTETDIFGSYVSDGNRFGYRESIYQHESKIVLSAELVLSERDSALIRADMDDYMARRIDKQPLEYPSAGSAFKRYPGYFTAQLIDEAGLKGYSVGGAQVSEKHAGFIINKGGATASDVLMLVSHIKHRIFELNGINIECEVRYIPHNGE